MFTGIVEEIGTVSSLVRSSQDLKILVHARKVLSDLKEGESLAINGVCLTVEEVGRNHFSATAIQETLVRTDLSKLRIGDKVNLERALSVNGRLGGHLVSGHIDCLAEVRGKIIKGQGFELLIAVPKRYLKYIVTKGSLTLEGVSLTVAKVDKELVTLAIVPQTAKSTLLGQVRIGDRLNLEVDMLSKYLEKHLQGLAPTDSEKMLLNSGFFPIGIIDN